MPETRQFSRLRRLGVTQKVHGSPNKLPPTQAPCLAATYSSLLEMKSKYTRLRPDKPEESATDVLSRIESLVLSFLRRISNVKSTIKSESLEEPCTQEQSFLFPQASAAEDIPGDLSATHMLLRPLTYSSIARSANLLAVIRSVFSLHAENRYTTLRQLYYSNICIAHHQRVVDRTVATLTQQLQVPREILHITSTAKCIIRGPITIQEKTTLGVAGVRAEASIKFVLVSRRHTCIPIDERNPLTQVVEKETVFYSLIDDQFIERHGPCVLVTGKGFPDISSRNIVWHLSQQFGLRVPIFLLTDFDPHGLLVAMTYAFPTSKEEGFYFPDFSVPTAIILPLPAPDDARAFCGLLASETAQMTATKGALLNGTRKKHARTCIQTGGTTANHAASLTSLNAHSQTSAHETSSLAIDVHVSSSTKICFSLRSLSAKNWNAFRLDVLKDLPLIIRRLIDAEVGVANNQGDSPN
ncbi:hypothetical protein Esti_006273 [Eimeria stiedai]